MPSLHKIEWFMPGRKISDKCLWQIPSRASCSSLFPLGPTICSPGHPTPTPGVASSSGVCWVTADQPGAVAWLASGNWDCWVAGLLSDSVGSRAHLIKPLSRLIFGHSGNQESEKDGEQGKMNEADAQWWENPEKYTYDSNFRLQSFPEMWLYPSS